MLGRVNATSRPVPKLWVEVGLVMALSLAQSGVYAVLSLVRRLLRTESLANQQATMNQAQDAEPLWDAVYRLTGTAFALVPVLLALYLLAVRPAGLVLPAGQGPLRRAAGALGFNFAGRWRNLGWGAALAAGVGLPGIGFYLLGRALGMTVDIQTSGSELAWWTVLLLVVAAAQAGITEEVLVVGYLMTRLEQLEVRPWAVLAASALLRGSYHLYQGWGPFLGNVAMGVVFGLFFLRTRRVMPLVVAHTLMDTVAFIGPSLLPAGLLG
jgi:membrane protease YdiL (CAAX protease family)